MTNPNERATDDPYKAPAIPETESAGKAVTNSRERSLVITMTVGTAFSLIAALYFSGALGLTTLVLTICGANLRYWLSSGK